jgi:hypothetical protein
MLPEGVVAASKHRQIRGERARLLLDLQFCVFVWIDGHGERTSRSSAQRAVLQASSFKLWCSIGRHVTYRYFDHVGCAQNRQIWKRFLGNLVLICAAMASSAIEAKALAKAETFIPRSYQEEIFAKAKESNIIAALDTGSGKTYISTMLIKWATSREAARGKLVVFLVPKVPLVDQQANFIADQTPLRVCKLHGIIGVDMTDRAGWRKKFKRYDVFVLTGIVVGVPALRFSEYSAAQIFLNLLTHSHCRMSQATIPSLE